MTRRHPRATRTDTRLPDPTPSRSAEDGGRLPSAPPFRETMGRGTVAAGDGGGAATSRHSPSVSASRCHLPIASRQGGLERQLPTPKPTLLMPHIRRRSLGSARPGRAQRSEEHTSELQSLMRISYAVFCLKKKTAHTVYTSTTLERITPSQ